MDGIAYVDGEWTGLDEASVSVRDRGFVFGDGVYEVVRLLQGELFRRDAHVRRLRRSADELDFPSEPTAEQIASVASELVERGDRTDGMIYLQLTRGPAPRSAAFPEETDPTLVGWVDAVRRDVGSFRAAGASAITVREIRWDRCDVKSVNLLPKVLMKERARRAGAYEALFVGESGIVHEGASTNVFAVDGQTIATPPASRRILDGITRREVLEAADRVGLEAERRKLHVDELFEADELFLTGTLTEVLGLVEIDGQPVADGDVGPTTRRLQQALTDRMETSTR
ncbi:MAG: aminotransferase class IV [Bradymonadaceae bacterium]